MRAGESRNGCGSSSEPPWHSYSTSLCPWQKQGTGLVAEVFSGEKLTTASICNSGTHNKGQCSVCVSYHYVI